ncbi:protein phosphatase 1M isoform X2 [Alligator mississippiensis]|uniref:protein phosphatase 1M isoform X2 n=1 Tax=Alligator mississippiensis TaxID=8496 RepID=UPI0009072EDF|nr:protein phosphatase 1M isoform X2 [Alligator mississippiensis]
MSSNWLKKHPLRSRSMVKQLKPDSLRQGEELQQPQAPASPMLPYRRPKFLHGVQSVKEPGKRPIYCPARDRLLPWKTGYAEVINVEKSEFNEDQATCCKISMRRRETSLEENQEWLSLCSNQYLTGYYWAIFDGHGGPEAAIIASNYLHYCIKQKLEEVVEGIIKPHPPMHLKGCCICNSDPLFVEEKQICQEDVIIGALENAFQECDEMICQEMKATNQAGGCTALAVLYLQGKLFVANAGDSRAVVVQKHSIMALSSEFTPETERQRIQHLAFLNPKLLADEFTRFEFPRRLKRGDVGHKVLYRDYFMAGWGYKTVEKDDLKYPLIHGHGKQVNVLDFAVHDVEEDDVLVLATDGLWEILSNEEVAQIVRSFLEDNKMDLYRFSELAKCLVQKARGMRNGHQWTLENNNPASYDDISVFVIPLNNRDRES